ncbi:MAG: response regulator [Chloroflexi bacterium]|nr:response regulator [Chloroflexota bacterium]
MVVEDDPDISDLLTGILEEQGYSVVPVTDGRDAVRVAAERKPDLITLDLALPGVDGWAIARQLHEEPRTEAIPILVISAHTSDLGETLRTRVARVICKPFYFPQVLHDVADILGERGDGVRQ